jgi:tetratricopeptide (TPR) repeat protein
VSQSCRSSVACGPDANAHSSYVSRMWILLTTLALATTCELPGTTTPVDFNALTDAGRTHAARGRFPQAEACFLQAHSLEPLTFFANANLGSLHHDWAQQTFEQDEADGFAHIRASKQYLDGALALPAQVETPLVMMLQSRNHLVLDESDLAIEVLSKVLKSTPFDNPTHAEALRLLGEFVGQAGPPRTEAQRLAYNTLYLTGVAAVENYILVADKPAESRPSKVRRASLHGGIEALDEAVALRPGAWPAWWFKGKAHEALGEQQLSLDAFQQAYAVNPYHPDLAREYILALCHQRPTEALPVSRDIVSFHSGDHTLLANHALVLLLIGDVEEARSTAATAMEAAPDDAITRDLLRVIDDVLAGERERPTKLPITD